MKKKIMIGISCIVIFVAAFIVWTAGKSTGILQDLDAGTVGRVEIYYPGDNLTLVTGEEEIKKVFALFHSMHVRKIFSDDVDGFAFSIQIYNKNGERMDSITIRSDGVATDDGYYRCDRDYCDDFRKLYEELQA